MGLEDNKYGHTEEIVIGDVFDDTDHEVRIVNEEFTQESTFFCDIQ